MKIVNEESNAIYISWINAICTTHIREHNKTGMIRHTEKETRLARSSHAAIWHISFVIAWLMLVCTLVFFCNIYSNIVSTFCIAMCACTCILFQMCVYEAELELGQSVLDGNSLANSEYASTAESTKQKYMIFFFKLFATRSTFFFLRILEQLQNCIPIWLRLFRSIVYIWYKYLRRINILQSQRQDTLVGPRMIISVTWNWKEADGRGKPRAV